MKGLRDLPAPLLGKNPPTPPEGGLKFDWLMTVLTTWFVGGLFVDGWAHLHLESGLDTFFTPWHAMLYSGFGVCAAALLAYAWKHRAGRSFWTAVPKGYGPSLLGVIIFATAGAGDFVWHTFFAFEKDIESLLSPTHLILGTGATLIFSGALRAAWYRPGSLGRWPAQWLPAALSLTYTLSTLSFLTQFAHPVRVTAGGAPPEQMLFDWYQARGIAGFLLQTAMLAGFSLLFARRWGRTPPFGFFSVVFTLNAYGMAVLTDEFRLVWAALAAGVITDVNVRELSPSLENPSGLRLFAFSVPVVYMLTYFIALMLTGGIWWSVQLWVGSIVMSGAGGFLLSYLVVPPPVPQSG